MKIDNIIIQAEPEEVFNILRAELKERYGKSYFNSPYNYTGDDFQFACPSHKQGLESHPSCGLLLKDKGKHKAGTIHCFTCGYTSNLFKMIGELFNEDQEFGKEWVLSHFVNIQIEEKEPLISHLIDDEVKYVDEEELKKYRVKHPYMYERKLTDEVIDLFDIGYNADFMLKSKKDNKEYNIPSITFPVRDIKGRTLFVATRSIQGKIFHYPENVDKPLYGIYELMKTKTKPNEVIFITESMINCLTIWSYNKKAIALNGTGSDIQAQALKRLPYGSFIIALDPDDAGKKGSMKLIKSLKDSKIIYILDYGDVKDDINKMDRETFNKLKVKRVF